MSKTLVVTGASGFVGRSLIQRGLQAGWEVRPAARHIPQGATGWTRLSEIELDNHTSKVTWNDLFHIETGTPTAVVHLAGRAHVISESAKNSIVLFRKANVDFALMVAEAAFARGVKRFVFVSSIGAVNDRSELTHPLSELSQCTPNSAYGISKLEAEIALSKLALNYNAELVIVRPPLVYGQGAPGNLAKMGSWVARGIPLPLARIQNQRSLIHVRNLCDALLCCADNDRAPGKIFHVRDLQDYSTPEILNLAAKAVGRKANLFPMPINILNMAAKLFGQSRAFDRLCGTLQVDDSLIRKELGFMPTVYPFEI